MKITGSVEIHVVDSRTKIVKQVIKQNNLITNTAYLDVLHYYARGVFSDVFQPDFGNIRRTYIAISNSTAQPNPNVGSLPGLIATGYVVSGIDPFTWNGLAEPPFGQIQNRIDFTGTERVFTTIGLVNESRCYAYLLLDTPCTQGAYDYLDLFYRIQFFNSEGQNLCKQATIDFGGATFASASFNMGKIYTSVCSLPNNDFNYQDFYYGDDLGFNVDGRDALYGWTALGAVNNHFKFKMAARFGLDGNSIGSDLAGAGWTSNINGWIFNMMLQGVRSDGRGVYTANRFSSESLFQNLFSHSSNATVPFFDSLKLASGNGKVYLNGNWTNKLPEFYKITIVNSGATGVASYKWSVRKHLGFNGNAYSDRSVACPFRNPTTPAFEKCHGWRDENNDVLRYSNTQIVQYDDTGLTLLDLLDGSYKNWDATTIPALPVMQARQCAIDTAGQKIYVACRNTGLWVIDVAANTVTNIYSVPCYGVDVGRNAITYAMVEGGLYRSSDWSTPLNFTYAGITDNNWSKVYFLKADPEHVEDRLAIVMQPASSGNRRVVWYRVNSPTIPAGTFQFDSFGDAGGICYWIGTSYGTASWINPHDAGRVTVVMSSVDAGGPSNMVNRQGGQNNHTQNIVNSWIAIDLGVGNTLTPNYYILQQRGVDGGYAIRNWKFQGSNNAVSNSVADLNNATWTDLDVRVNDTSMGTNVDAWAGYTANAAQGYRWLKILQTGVNSSDDNYLILGEFEFYGTFSSTTASRIPPARLAIATHADIESSNLKPWAASLDVSDTGSFWVAGGVGKLNYGSASTTGLNTDLCSQQLTHSIWGSDRYFKIAFYKKFLIGQDKIINDAAVAQNSYTSFGDKAFLIHLDSGIALTNREMRQMFTDNTYCWENHGWDGSKWVLNEARAKTTHALEQALANGLTIKFQDGANTPQFTATDYYTQSVNYGLLKDNATTIYYESAWYSKPAQFNYSVQSNAVVPSTPSNPPPAATAYWRLKNLTPSTGGTDGDWGYREIIFKNEAGVDITTGGVATASYDSGNAFRAFDKDTSYSVWAGERYGLNWIQYTFANPVVVYSISINGYIPDSNYGMPIDYVLEYSVNGVNWLSAYEFRINITSDNFYYNIAHQYNTSYELYLSAKDDINFIRIETDSVELTKLTLNNQPITTTYTESGIPPAPNEAVVFGNGRVKFNAADTGKTLGGTYAYVKN